MQQLIRQRTSLSRRVGSTTAIAVFALVSVVDIWVQMRTSLRINFAILYLVPLLISAVARDRQLIWSLTALAVAMTYLAHFLGTLAVVDGGDIIYWINRSFVAFAVLSLGIGLHLYLTASQSNTAALAELEQRHFALEQSNFELAQREEEIARQNEELQSQTEELERQSEELRVTNDELQRREKMLESLLSLSRGLANSTSRDETMNRICRTLGDLINGAGTATAIKERRGDEVHIVCHHGFGPDGPDHFVIPYHNSFAALILDRGRTGFLEDVSLRPDLQIPQRRQGKPLRSVMATPLRTGGKIIGSLEVFHDERHVWSDEQILLLESLAAQTSVSLEAATLFESIENERARLRAILDTVPFGVAIAEAGSTEMRLNPAGAAMLNVPPNIPLDPMLTGRWRLYHDGRPVDAEHRPLTRAVLHGEEIIGEEYDIVFPNGRRISIILSAAPIRTRDGREAGAVTAFVDITRQKQLQLELDTRRREAEESSVRKSRFLAAVSHDIRTPANAISLLAELLDRTSASPTLAEELPEIVRDLKTSAITLVNLVSDVLDLTRFDAGRIDLNETEFSLAQIVEDECRALIPVARDKGLHFECTPPPPSLTVRADRVKLSRILGNLISNAIKFTASGQVHVSAEQSADGAVAIRVSDTGPGIPPEHHERIFDEFFQLKHASSSAPRHNGENGTGLGLAICRRLAIAMGGQITVQSEPGNGSTFTLTLPATTVVPV